MKAPLYISRRISFKGRAAIVSIAVSFLVIIIAISISGGFRKEISDALSSLRGDLRVEHLGYSALPVPVKADSSLLEMLRHSQTVRSVCPAVWAPGIVKGPREIHGVVFKGVQTADSASLDVTIPRKLSTLMGLAPGDRMLTYFIGESVTVRNFTVAGIYDSIVTDDDKMVVMCDIATLRRVLRWDFDEASSLEITLKDRYLSDEGSLRAYDELSFKMYDLNEAAGQGGDDGIFCDIGIVRTRSEYPQLFDWLSLIDFNVDFILALMILVAGFNMVSGLLILLFENMSTIGLLKTMGMPFKDIAKTFLLSSASLVLRGMLLGNVFGIGLCLVQRYSHILRLDPENYFLSFVPVEIDPVWILSCDIVAFVAIMLILLIPCRFISGVDPSRTVAAD